MPDTSLARSRSSEFLLLLSRSISISLGLYYPASLPTWTCAVERGAPGQESRTLGPHSHFAVPCCVTLGEYLSLSGLVGSSQRLVLKDPPRL